MHYQHARSMSSDVMLVTEDGEVITAGTHDQMYSFVKHHVIMLRLVVGKIFD